MSHEGAERELVVTIIGPGNCPTCLNPKASQLHRELCATAQQRKSNQ